MNLEPISPEHALELYLGHRRNEVAQQTLESHESRINKLVDWCDEQAIENMNELTGRDLYEYRIWRRNDGNLVKTSEKTQMATIRVFIRFLESIEAVEPDLHTKVQLPSLSDDDDVRILYQARTPPRSLHRRRLDITTHGFDDIQQL